MFMYRSIVNALIVLCVVATVCAEPSTEFWEKALPGMLLDDLARKMRMPESPAWPRVSSIYAISKMSATERSKMEKRIGLLNAFRNKLEKGFVQHSALDNAGLAREIDTLATIADKLRGAGGYGNLVVADSIDRLLVFRLSGWIIAHPGEVSVTKAMVERLASTELDPKETLLRLVDEDSYLDERRADITKIDSGKHIFIGLAPIGLEMSDVMSLIQTKNSHTNSLLEKPSAVALVVRMTETAAMRKVHLPGLVRFLERGGQFEELSYADVRAFESRMRGETATFRFPPLGIKRLTEQHLLTLLEIHATPSGAERYLALALR